mgnify:CR=1 FL=1
MIAIWPRLDGAAEVLRQITEKQPQVDVGVMQPARPIAFARRLASPASTVIPFAGRKEDPTTGDTTGKSTDETVVTRSSARSGHRPLARGTRDPRTQRKMPPPPATTVAGSA